MTNSQQKLIESVTRRLYGVCREHDESPGEVMSAFVLTAVSLARWLGMTPDQFLTAFGQTFRISNDAAVPGYPQPTIIGGEGKS